MKRDDPVWHWQTELRTHVTRKQCRLSLTAKKQPLRSEESEAWSAASLEM